MRALKSKKDGFFEERDEKTREPLPTSPIRVVALDSPTHDINGLLNQSMVWLIRIIRTSRVSPVRLVQQAEDGLLHF